MRVKIKQSVLSSKKYDIRIRNAFRKTKRKDKKISKIVGAKPRSPRARLSKKIINTPKVLIFPKNLRELTKHLDEIKELKDSCKLSINHSKIQTIDNVSILLLTAGVNGIFDDKKLVKNKKLAPNKEINERLSAIGYWEALCVNPPISNKDLDYLKIRNHDGEKIDNNLHTDILDFFIKHHNIPEIYRDNLFDAIYEAMANIKEHAYSGTKRNLWFLGAYDKDKDEIEFLIYDKGMGIFKSLETSNKMLANFLRKCVKMFGKDKTLEILCTTNLSKHKKTDKKRGLGMKTYKEFVDSIKSGTENAYASLEVATDNLLYASEEGVVKMNAGIEGTLIRWKIGGLR